MIRKKANGDSVLTTFDEVGELLRMATSPTDMPDLHRSSLRGTMQFTETKSLDDAVLLARKGWTGGTAAIEKLRATIEKLLNGQVPIPERHYSMTKGKRVSLQRYIEGRPDCLVERIDKGQRRDAALPKSVRIVVNVSTTASVSGTPLLMRGAAVIVLCDLLNRYRIRTSVDLMSTWTTSVVDPDAPTLEYRLPLKHESDPINISKLAFFLGHRSSIRRIIFAAMEHEDKAVRHRFGVTDVGAYGIPATSIYQGDLYLDRIRAKRDWDETFAIAWLRAQLIAQGVSLKGV